MDVILGGANVLSVLADVVSFFHYFQITIHSMQSGGRWLRIWIVVDAIVVLCGGVLTGILSACELLGQLALHRVIPSAFLSLVPRTGSPYVSIFSFVTFGGLLYATASSSLMIISAMFSLVWLLVMGLFPVSLLLLRFNRGRLKREGRRSNLVVILAAILLVPLVFVGTVVYQPRTAV